MRIVLLILVCFLFLPASSLASSVVRSGETVTVASDQSVEGDFYGAGGTTAVSGEVKEDLLLLSGTVTMNGVVGADMLVAGGTVDVDGVVTDDLRVVGGVVTVAGEVKGDLVVFASELTVLSTASIGGDVIFFGGRADLAGSVGKDVLGTNESVRIDGLVGGRLDVTTHQLTLGDRSVIEGTVSYTSPLEVTRAQNAVVKGAVVRSDFGEEKQIDHRAIALSFLVWLFAALLVHLLFRSFTDRIVTAVMNHPLRTSSIGFAFLFLAPLAAAILILSTLGSIIGVLVLFGYFTFVSLSIPLIGIVAGAYGLKLFGQSAKSSALAVTLGVIVVSLCLYVPVIGPFIIIGLLLLVLGALIELVYRLVRA